MPTHRIKRLWFVTLALAGLVTSALLDTACSSSAPTEPTSAWLRKTKTTDFAVSGTATLFAIGQTTQLTAKVNSAQGQLNVTKNVTWTSADPAVATVSALGVATATGFGTTNVTAHLNDSEVTQRVDVLAATGLTISSTSPDGNILRSGVLSFSSLARTAQLILTGTWPGGITRVITADTTWSSVDPAIASISASGLLRSNAFGATDVVAKYQSLTLSTKVDVAAVFSSLSVQGNLNLNSPGEVSVLTVLARFTDGINRNVSNEVTWTTSNAAVATVSSTSILTAMSFGQASITATYQGHVITYTVSVTPPGTFAIGGRARDPGNGDGQGLGVPGFTVRDLQTGISTVTDAKGSYGLVGIRAGDRLRFEKDGWEPVELVINKATDDGSPAVQPVVRITAGDTAAITTAPNDLRYELAPGIACNPCRLVRIVNPTAGTLHLRLTWTGSPAVRLSLWAAGQAFSATTVAPIVTTADVAVAPGETLVYAGLIGGGPFSTGYLNLTLTTSLAAAPNTANALSSHKE